VTYRHRTCRIFERPALWSSFPSSPRLA